MKNGDMPASPLESDMSSDMDSAIGSPDKYGMPTAIGLTKREAFAKAAMQGMSGSTAYIEASWDEIGKQAVEAADALLKALEE